MSKEVKQQLIEILEQENKDLKDQIEQLEERGIRLEQRIADLQLAVNWGRRGLPWR